MSEKLQTMGFQTEVKQMLHLVIHSLYSNKEIFLRELISNASDALDKLRFLALSNASLYENDSALNITVECNEKLKTITIKDNGIGMSFDEAVENLGTIAKSGTKEFLNHLTGESAKDSHLIGQFGVGFYSAFIIASKVVVKSRRAGLEPEQGIVWESAGDGEFQIGHHKQTHRGTEIILHIKKDAEEFLSDWKLKSIITKYSNHISWPVQMQKIETATEGDEKKEDKAEKAKAPEFETVNKATALWTLNKSEIKDDDYKALYRDMSHDYEDPLTWSHNHVEGKQDYISLLYIPSHAPFDLWQQESKHGLKLYVKRVFIMDDAIQFLPRYLRFIKGIIDASDLPLNVSREILQDNKQVDAIKTACTKRVLSMIEKLSDDKETYQKFWDAFGLAIKEGPVEDMANKETIAKLLRFTTLQQPDEKQCISLADYIKGMKEGQDKIYYLTASSYNAAKHSPHLEIFKKKGYDVLLLSDKIDEWLVGYLTEFEGKKLQSVAKGKVDFEIDPEEAKATKAEEENFAPMMEHMKKILDDKVKEIVITHRLTDSPTCVVADENDMGMEMQRILKSAGHKIGDAKPIFEINPKHPLIKRLHDITDDAVFEEWTHVLFDQAVLAEGGELANPADFVRRINTLLGK
jgi:molecular chaperone HtpG